MNRVGTLEQIRTSKHIRTRCSIPVSTGRGRMTWSRVKETETLQQEYARLKAYGREQRHRRSDRP